MIHPFRFALITITALTAFAVLTAHAAERPIAVERLTIRWVQGEMQLVSRIPMQKVLPPAVTLPDSTDGLRGSWFELQNDKGEVLYRRLMPAVNIAYTETPVDPASGMLSRAETTVDSTVFSVLVPASAAAKRVVFHGPAPEAKSSRSNSTEIGRLDLK